MTLEELIQNAPKNKTIGDNLIRAWSIINSSKYDKAVCTISGGADSDIVLDICTKVDINNKIDYIWFDTGLEYQATKEHLKFLETKYNVEIRPFKAIKPIPISCRNIGQPFLSKNVSEMIYRLQKHNFQWEDEPLDVLLPRYCKWDEKKQDWVGCKGALMWWCNANEGLQFCVGLNKWLKEFMVLNPPQFKVSSKCCHYAKKDIIHKLIANGGYDLNISGIRKFEYGIRSTAYKNCFDEKTSCDNYRPIFWYTDEDKQTYEQHYGIVHSDCYTEYGLKRTGCAGCPFGRDFEEELRVIENYEPKLFKAVNNIFGDSYNYTRKYKEFCVEMDKQYGSYNKYLRKE